MADFSPSTSRRTDAALTSATGALPLSERQTIEHLMRRGMGANSLRALRSDIAYIEAWCRVACGTALPWPPDRDIVLRFIAHHLWDPDEQARDPGHGMPQDVREELVAEGVLRSEGPHAPSTVRRRLSSWRSLCNWQDLDHPFARAEIRKTLNLAIKAGGRARRRKSAGVVDIPLMERLLDHLDELCALPVFDAESQADRLRAKRDRALFAVMFSSGGRRRSEVADLMRGQVTFLDPIPTESAEWPDGLPSAGIRLGRSKTTTAEEDATCFMTGRSVTALEAWLKAASIEAGPVFRRIDRWGKIFGEQISPHSVNQALKGRLADIGEDPKGFSAHGVRAGYISSALMAGIPAPEVMEQTQHRSMATLLGYFKDARQREGRAARLL